MNKMPIYGIDFKDGDHAYTITDDSFVSEGICWMQNKDEELEFLKELEQYGIDGFSHVIKFAYPETLPDGRTVYWAYESSTHGVVKFNLMDRILDPKVKVVFRRPIDMDHETLTEALIEAERLKCKKTQYNFPGIVGQAVMITMGLADRISWLRKTPLPFTMPWTYFCSQFVCKIEKYTKKYCNIDLFKNWHISRIHVHKLWNEFPYKPLRFDE